MRKIFEYNFTAGMLGGNNREEVSLLPINYELSKWYFCLLENSRYLTRVFSNSYSMPTCVGIS